jgi:shikimate kinase
VVTADQHRPAVVLIGPPGSGKTTTGRALAELLGATFHDTDHAVEEAAGRAISDIFIEDGEGRFRTLERAAVTSALSTVDGVLALGAGAAMDGEVQQALAGHTVVFLDVGIADAAKRVGFDQSRPLLLVNPRQQWVRLMERRRPTYERLASTRVDTAGRSAAEVAEEVAGWLRSGAPAPPTGGTRDGGER